MLLTRIYLNLTLKLFTLQIDPCAWFECHSPPLPDGHNLEFLSDGFPTPFHHNVTYRCRRGFFFEHDRDQRDFLLMCRDNGYFLEPNRWPKCIRGEFDYLY